MNLVEAPCVFCGYNGPNYWQAGSHDKNCPWHDVGGGYERMDLLREVVGKLIEFEECAFCGEAIKKPVDHDSETYN